MVRIKFYKAKSGDAFLLSLGCEQDLNIMIDMGYASTYEDYIEQDLKKINSNNKRLDLLIITHIDRDHIGGVLKFIEKNEENQKIIRVGEVWHNSYKHLQFDKKEKSNNISQNEKQALKELINQNKINLDSSKGVSHISVKDGTSLASLLYQYNYKWNFSFDKNAVMSLVENQILDLKITTISPSKEKLKTLAKIWERKLNSIIYNFKMSEDEVFDDAFELYMQNTKPIDKGKIENASANKLNNFYTCDDIIKLANIQDGVDGSHTNGSSMAFIFEYDNKRLLFLGDAHEDLMYENLQELKRQGDNLNFELIKISHHGSLNNTSNRLLDIVNAPKYIISTDGESFEHPSISTIAKIISKKTSYSKDIYFNYDIERIKPFNNTELKAFFNYNIIISDEITLN